MPFDFGNKLRQLRLEKGYSQEYLADILKISQKTYSNIENNKSIVSISRLKRIAEEYQIDLMHLLSDEKKNTESKDSHSKTPNTVSEELINQMKERIEEFKFIVYEKNKQIELLEKKLNT